MQVLTWMLIAFHGGVSTLLASPLSFDAPRHDGACPELLAPPFHIALSAPPQPSTEGPGTATMTMAPVLEPALHAFELRAGRLKPQLESLLRQHFAIQHVVWNAPEGLLWPADYSLRGDTPDAMMRALLAPYHLQLRLYANHTAVVQAQAMGGE